MEGRRFLVRNSQLLLLISVLLLSRTVALAQSSVDARYQAILTKTPLQQKQVILQCSAAEQAEIWTAHLKRFLADHPDLNGEQRSVIYEGLGLLAAGVIERARLGQAEISAVALAEIDHFDERAKASMSRELGRAAFAELGPAEPALAVSLPHLIARPLSGECECSARSDWCLFGDCYYTLTGRRLRDLLFTPLHRLMPLRIKRGNMRLSAVTGVLCGLILIATEAFARKAFLILLPYAVLIAVMAMYGRRLERFAARFGMTFTSLTIATFIFYCFVAMTADTTISPAGHVWRIAALIGTAALCSAATATIHRQIN